MKTSKPFSTISYNSVEFLTVKLSELVQRRKIAFYGFVHHLPEEDEKKAHKHLYIVPNGQLNTDEVLDYLTELDPTHPDKPLGCIPPHPSKFGDWYLYAKHDTDYLASKGQSRKYHYDREEFVVSDDDYFNEEIHRIDLSALSKVKNLRIAAQNGTPFSELVVSGQIPVQQVYAYQQTYEIIREYTDKLNRADRSTHTPSQLDIDGAEHPVDPVTGEIIE